MLKIYCYDDIFLELSELWIQNLMYGLPVLENYQIKTRRKQEILDFIDTGLNGIYHSTDPEVLNTLMEIHLTNIILHSSLDDKEIQEIFILKELILALQMNNYDTFFQFAECFCSKEIFTKLSCNAFKTIKEKSKT